MTGTKQARRVRAIVVTAVLAAVLALLTGVGDGPALAKGKHGPVSWPASPLSCSYSGSTLASVRVTPPRVSMDKALARQGGTAQYVGVEAMLQGLSGGHWRKVVKRPSKRAYAASVLVHPRKLRSVGHKALLTFQGRALKSTYSAFRVKVTLEWYAYNGRTVRGRVSRTTGACSRTLPPHVVQIDAGYGFACARMSNATVRCWGEGNNGRLGDGSTVQESRPITVAGLSSVSSLAVGYDSVCAVTGVVDGYGGVAHCWGANAHGQIGDGTTTDRSRPTTVAGLSNATVVWNDRQTVCGGERGHGLICWGLNNGGQVGNKSSTDVKRPTEIKSETYIVSATTGNEQACAVNNTGGVACWGKEDATYHQLGHTGLTGGTYYGPESVTGVSGASLVASGGESVCAVVTNGAVKCWGADNEGQLGNGETTTASASAVSVKGLTGVTAISAMNNSVCAVSGGGVYCWGGNASGQLGNGTTTNFDTPQRVAGIGDAVGVVVGNTTAYAWDAAGRVWAWGDNSTGQFGNGTTTSSLRPVAVGIH